MGERLILMFLAFLALNSNAQEYLEHGNFEHGIFSKKIKEKGKVLNKGIYQTLYTDAANGVNEFSWPQRVLVTGVDSSVIKYEITRAYENGLIERENILNHESNELRAYIQYEYYNVRDHLFKYVNLRENPYYEVEATYRDRSFFYSPIGYDYDYLIYGEQLGYGPYEYYTDFDSTVAVVRNGQFRGYKSFYDPNWNTEWEPRRIYRESFVVEYEMDIRPLSEDSALVYEYFYNKSTESHDTVIQYASLKDGFLHTVYEEIPGSGPQEFQKVVYESWHDPFEFERKEWTYYETKDGGQTWDPYTRRIVDGVMHEWRSSQYFKYNESQSWDLDADYFYIYNPLTRRLLFKFSSWDLNSSTTFPKYGNSGIIEVKSSPQNQILHEVLVSGDSSNILHHYFYSDFGGPNSSIKESVSHPWLVYPNPCSNELKILNGRGMGKVFNLEGREIMRLNMSQEIHDVSKLPAGLYKMVDDNGVCLGFVKQ